MNEPSVWQAILADPTVPFDRVTLGQVVRDQQRPSRRWLYPWLRHVSRAAVWLIRLVKALLPVRFSAHSTMDTACVWFLRRFVSVDAGALLLRHFVVETNLLNFITANTDSGIEPVTLRPRTTRGPGQPRGDRARRQRVRRADQVGREPPRNTRSTELRHARRAPARPGAGPAAVAQAGHPVGAVSDEHPVRRLPHSDRVRAGRALDAPGRLHRSRCSPTSPMTPPSCAGAAAA